ncbi:hypothetical protein [Mycobacterium servetii]|uniref:Uncharacterized protein n=1 Tax=Mycobacterium servetii TaxID=3237418 RepID=A0ABV4BWY3_9MYCO
MRKVRAVSGAADQVFSSMSNGLIIYAVAVVTPPDKFGQIALLLTLLAAAIGVLRGALGTPLLLTAARDRSDIRREGSFAITSALLASPIVGGIMWAVQGSGIGAPALLIVAATPIVLVGDVLRYVVIAEGRPHVAALWDGVWFAGSAALLVATWLHWSMATAVDLIGGWAALALIALLGLLIGVRVAPRFTQLPAWMADGWQHRARYGTESGLEQTTAFAVLLFAALVLSPGVTAALRGATALLAPLAILTSAIPLVVIPDSRRQNMTPPQVWRSLARIASASTSGAILIGAALYFLPATIGELVLGHTFREAQAITPIIAFEYAVGSWIIAVTIHLRTFNRSADALRLKAGYVLLMILTALGGGMLFRTAAGVAVGIATATTFITAIALLLFKPWARPGDGTTPEFLEPVAPDPLRAIRSGQGAGSGEAGIVAAYRHLRGAVPGPVPAAVKLRLNGRVQSSQALITLWALATMVIFVPAAIIRFTGVPTSSLWLWSLPGIAISGARFAWLLGNGERRLFEVMFWGYSYAFLGLAPLVQLRENDFPDTVPRVDSTYTAAAALIVIVGCCAFLAGAALDNATKLGRSWRATQRSRDVAATFTVNNARLVLLCGFAIFANMYYCSKVGWLLFLKSRTDALNIEANAWGETNVGVIMRSCSCMALLVAFIALMRFRKEAKLANLGGEKISATVMRSNLVLLVIVGLLLANAMNPISNARYLAGTAILAAATAFGLFATTRRFRATSCGFLIGLLVIFPLADAFRVSTQAELKATNPIASLLSPDYDSFAELMNGYLVGAQQGIVPGKQFSGVLLFWLPRTMWTEKPVDTGIYIANMRGYPFTNLSAPLWIEMYLNGGWIPLAAGMFVLGYALHRWDTRLDTEFDVYRMPGLLGCILPFYMMILLRGSLLQAASFLFFIGVFSTFVRERETKTRPGVAAVPRQVRPNRRVELVRTDYVGA